MLQLLPGVLRNFNGYQYADNGRVGSDLAASIDGVGETASENDSGDRGNRVLFNARLRVVYPGRIQHGFAETSHERTAGEGFLEAGTTLMFIIFIAFLNLWGNQRKRRIVEIVPSRSINRRRRSSPALLLAPPGQRKGSVNTTNKKSRIPHNKRHLATRI